ncbi:MAG: peptide-methionine (S)-S-oxide reductase MsrA [Methylococcales symbiont of Iophon sp. n. MRB-2018]|nr:MAG: peptide-methionine (S)-S-oxide reductase MsrA [Methylococcales symbiont of Iophon sp. n. MRB-2018]KAF3979618.1 MAG: peptide-methionine (S)-S-oxide reductase MsrA [Methylococcales symbiont of Iophon sp. n. MRB-2018]
MLSSKNSMPSVTNALPERNTAISITKPHFVTANIIVPPFPAHIHQAMFGLGCFWGAERKFWQQPGVFSTAVGYSGGHTENPTYDELCTGLTGHNEVVKVFFDPNLISYQQLLIVFWQSHNPTQGMQQGNDKGTQYRSGIYTFTDEQQSKALESMQHYQNKISLLGFKKITTEIQKATTFYYAENYHQQYLAKNPLGYCGVGGVGIEY